MKFVKIIAEATRERVLEVLENPEMASGKSKYDERRGKPNIKTKTKGNWLYATCEMVGGYKKDNGFLVGTYFLGRMKEKDGKTYIGGVVVTSPIYHLLLLGFCIFFIVRAILTLSFNFLPVVLSLFSLFMFKDEFKKQGIIKYAFKKTEWFLSRESGVKTSSDE